MAQELIALMGRNGMPHDYAPLQSGSVAVETDVGRFVLCPESELDRESRASVAVTWGGYAVPFDEAKIRRAPKGVSEGGRFVEKPGTDAQQELFPTPPSSKALLAGRATFAEAAQQVYDAWDENEDEYAGGGICHLIAEEIAGVLNAKGIDAITVNNEGMGEQHVWVVAKVSDGVFLVDIPPNVYERGSGYTWTKVPGVRFEASDVIVDRIDADPAKFDDYTGYAVDPSFERKHPRAPEGTPVGGKWIDAPGGVATEERVRLAHVPKDVPVVVGQLGYLTTADIPVPAKHLSITLDPMSGEVALGDIRAKHEDMIDLLAPGESAFQRDRFGHVIVWDRGDAALQDVHVVPPYVPTPQGERQTMAVTLRAIRQLGVSTRLGTVDVSWQHAENVDRFGREPIHGTYAVAWDEQKRSRGHTVAWTDAPTKDPAFERKHPRGGKGTPVGGKFIEKPGSGASARALALSLLDRVREARNAGQFLKIGGDYAVKGLGFVWGVSRAANTTDVSVKDAIETEFDTEVGRLWALHDTALDAEGVDVRIEATRELVHDYNRFLDRWTPAVPLAHVQIKGAGSNAHEEALMQTHRYLSALSGGDLSRAYAYAVDPEFESKHPRGPKGTPAGGDFIKKPGGHNAVRIRRLERDVAEEQQRLDQIKSDFPNRRRQRDRLERSAQEQWLAKAQARLDAARGGLPIEGGTEEQQQLARDAFDKVATRYPRVASRINRIVLREIPDWSHAKFRADGRDWWLEMNPTLVRDRETMQEAVAHELTHAGSLLSGRRLADADEETRARVRGSRWRTMAAEKEASPDTLRYIADPEFEKKHPRGMRGSKTGGKFVEKPDAQQEDTKDKTAGAAKPKALPPVQVHPAKKGQRAFTGEPITLKMLLNKNQTGDLAEALAVAYLKSRGFTDAETLNVGRNNFALDLVHDHQALEIKAGLVSNGPSAQHWRATIGQPGKAEAAWLKTASAEEKAAHNAKKARAIMRRKAAAVREVSKHVGHPVTLSTMTMIIDPDRGVADLYTFPKAEARIGWTSPEAQRAYMGTLQFRIAKALAALTVAWREYLVDPEFEQEHPRGAGGRWTTGRGSVELVGDADTFRYGLDEPEDSDHFYHITTTGALKAVLRDGIGPGGKQTMAPGAYRELSRGLVFVTDRRNVAYWRDRIQEHLESQYDTPPKLVVVKLKRSTVVASKDPNDPTSSYPSWVVRPAERQFAADPEFETKHPRDAHGQFVEAGAPTSGLQSDPGFLYHATSVENARDIAETGRLDPHKPSYGTDQSVWPDGGTERRSYFTPNAGVAWQFAPEDGRPAILRVRQEAGAFKQESTGDVFSRKSVPADKLEILGSDGKWWPLAALFGKRVAAHAQNADAPSDNAETDSTDAAPDAEATSTAGADVWTEIGASLEAEAQAWIAAMVQRIGEIEAGGGEPKTHSVAWSDYIKDPDFEKKHPRGGKGTKRGGKFAPKAVSEKEEAVGATTILTYPADLRTAADAAQKTGQGVAGWWVTATGLVKDVSSDVGGGTNDHVGFLAMVEDPTPYGITQEQHQALHRFYVGDDEDGTHAGEFTDEVNSAFRSALQNNIRVRYFGPTSGLKKPQLALDHEGELTDRKLHGLQELIVRLKLETSDAEITGEGTGVLDGLHVTMGDFLTADHWTDLTRKRSFRVAWEADVARNPPCVNKPVLLSVRKRYSRADDAVHQTQLSVAWGWDAERPGHA